MLLEIYALLLPLREDSLNLLLNCSLLVLDLLSNLFKLLYCLLVSPFEVALFSLVVSRGLGQALLVLMLTFQQLLSQVMDLVLALRPHIGQLSLGFGHVLALLGELLMQ